MLDRYWMEHLVAMDHLKQGIHLQGYAGKDPKQEYKREAFAMFGEMLEQIKNDVIGILAKIQVRTEADVEMAERNRNEPQHVTYNHPAAPNALSGETGEAQAPEPAKQPFIRSERKIGRNEPCPCGSGKKYKQCHGRLN